MWQLKFKCQHSILYYSTDNRKFCLLIQKHYFLQPIFHRNYHVTAVSKVREIDEGFSFDLGNFHLNVIHLPGTICLKYFLNSDLVKIQGENFRSYCGQYWPCWPGKWASSDRRHAIPGRTLTFLLWTQSDWKNLHSFGNWHDKLV